jgi:esterase
MDTEPMVRDKTVTLNGLHFHYRDWGEPTAPAVVLLHAYTQHARSWDTVARGLADHFRVLAVDQRGHGETDWAPDYHEQRLVEDLEAFIDALGLEAVSLVGFSVGGSTACSYAARHPDRVARLVVLECVTDPDVDSEPALDAHLGLLRSLPETFAAPEDAAVAFRPLAPHAAEDELRHWMHGGLKQESDGHWTWRLDPALRVPGPPGRLNAPPTVFAERLAQVTCPVLLVVGAESFALAPSQRLAAAIPHVRFVTLPETGHWVPLDNPRGFQEVVGRFLNGEA